GTGEREGDPEHGGGWMKAVTWHGKRDVRVDDVPDPRIVEPTDAIVRVTSSGICGSDLHLYEVMGPFMGEGDVLGHEPMGIVEEVGPEVTDIAAERLELARRYGIETIDADEYDDVPGVIRELAGGRGTDSVIEAVGMEAHGDLVGQVAHRAASLLPDAMASRLIEKAGIDRM